MCTYVHVCMQYHLLYLAYAYARFWSKIADLNLPHLYLAPPLRMIWLEFCRDFWRQKTRARGYRVHCLCDPRFSHLCTTPTCDRQTDGQTDGRTDGLTDTR